MLVSIGAGIELPTSQILYDLAQRFHTVAIFFLIGNALKGNIWLNEIWFGYYFG
jgi:hypothetical protein